MLGTWHIHQEPPHTRSQPWPPAVFWPDQTVHQVAENLYQGASVDPVSRSEKLDGSELDGFNLVVTLYAGAAPSSAVPEIRLAIADSFIDLVDLDAVHALADQVHAAWTSGSKVLIRCQAGLNRSGLISALVLIRAGYTSDDAVDTIRAARGVSALHNPDFLRYLYSLDG